MRRLLLIVSVVVVAIFVLLVAAYAYIPSGQVAPGVHIGAIDLSGQTQDSARNAIDAFARDAQQRDITLRYAPTHGREHSWSFHAADLGLTIDVAATTTKALETARGNSLGRVSHLLGGSSEVHSVEPVPVVDSAMLTAAIKKIAHTVNRAAQNARVTVSEEGQFKIQPGIPGTTIDLPSSETAVVKLWDTMLGVGNVPAHQEPNMADAAHSKSQETDTATTAESRNGTIGVATGSVDLVLNAIKPVVSAEDVSRIDGPIGEMNTRIRGTAQRVRNVTIATGHINGTLLAPGGTFSYNRVVGKRSEEGGYQKAIVFVKGRHVEDVGGGICQTASTLYNAVLKSGLKVVRRQPHCTPVVYVPYGLDATVAYGVVDFQFQNDTECPVYIYARAKGRSLTFRIYGKTDSNRKIVLEKVRESSVPTSVMLVEDRTLRPGKRVVKDKGARGYSIVWRRMILENGKTIRSETINSHYRPIPAIVAVGPGVGGITPGPNTRAPGASAIPGQVPPHGAILPPTAPGV